MTRFGRGAEAFFLLVGSIVGIGMFGIPFVFAKSGFLVGALELAIVAVAITLVHLAYAEIVIQTPENHRLPGYVAYYLGKRAGWFAKASYFFGLSGSLLAYIVLGGFFLGSLLHEFFPALSATAGPIGFYLFGMLIMLRGLKFEGLANGILTIGLIAAVVGLAMTLIPHISGNAFGAINPKEFSTPYGVLLFAMAGAAVIPDMRKILAGSSPSLLRKVVAFGTATAGILYLIFAFSVVGAMGVATTPDAITGIAGQFGSSYLLIGAIIGFLAAITSFIPLGNVFQGMLATDFGIRPYLAWLITAGLPLALYLLGFQDFILIMSVIGAIGIGVDSIFILAIYPRAVEKSPAGAFRIPAPVFGILSLLFVVGAIIELAGLFS